MDEATLLDEAMLAWFPPLGTVELSTRSTFTETDLRNISDLLHRSGKPSWSRIPRIYTTLRLIDELDVIDSFLSCGISDLSLPFSQRTLPGQLKDQSSRVRFLDVQSKVLTKALDLEKEKGKHRHFSNPDDLPFKKIAELGKGGYGFVDKVLSTVTYREYARKLIPRGRTFRQDRDLLRDFENELQVLKKLSHQHIVRLIGSYTDPRYVGVLMDPVADCNLKVLLNAHPLSSDTRSLVRTFYGCLASAVLYLHENKLRHKDIKPENVLVKSHHVYLTDFGTTLDWSDTGHDTTTGLASGLTLRYSAPEVATNQPRNTSADIWSLGCVFLEIWTELCDHSTSELKSFMEDQGTKSSLYYANISAMTEWCDMLSSGTNNDAQIPNPWIRSMLKDDPSTRCSIQSLTEDIQVSNFGSGVTDSFLGRCCDGGYVVAESVLSSDDEASIMSFNQRDTASSDLSSADTVLSPIEVLEHEAVSSPLIVGDRGQSVHSGRFDREPLTTPSKTTQSKKCIGLSETQSHQDPTETIQEESGAAHYIDWSPDVDEYSRSKSKHSTRQAQSTQHATSLYDIEVSSLTPNSPRDTPNEKAHRSDYLHSDIENVQRYTHFSDGPSEATSIHPIENLLAPHSRQGKVEMGTFQIGNTKDEPSMLQPPLVGDRSWVNGVIRLWLANFDPLSYHKIMTIELLGHHIVPMYRLGESKVKPELSSLYKKLTDDWHNRGVWEKFRCRMMGADIADPRNLTHGCVSLVKRVTYALAYIHVPFVEREGSLVCFYPRGILPKYGDFITRHAEPLRSFRLLEGKRHEVLQWWHNCLTSPQDTWTEKLRENEIFEVQFRPLDRWDRMAIKLTTLLTAQDLGESSKTGPEYQSSEYRFVSAALLQGCRFDPRGTTVLDQTE